MNATPPAPAPRRDSEGYLIDPDDWTDEVAQQFAAEIGIPLEDDHWLVLQTMRTMYEERRVAPDARHVIKVLDAKYPGHGRARLFELFPYGYVAQACKLAGMKRPRAWSTG